MTSLLVSSIVIATFFAAADHSSLAASTSDVTHAAPQPPKTFEELYRQTICDNQRSCHLVGNVSEADKTLAVRNCMCDAECNVYGDCCFDSPLYNEQDQRTNFKRFHCPKENWYMKASCVAGYGDREIVRRCADGVKGVSNDVRVITPVTDVDQNVTYANVYCAMCDERDPRLPSLRPWNVTFKCEVNATSKSSVAATAAAAAGRTTTTTTTQQQQQVPEARATDELEASSVARNLSWDEELGEYRAYYRGRAYKCEPLRQPPDVGAGLRRCAAVVAGCPAAAAAADGQLAANCESFTLLVHDEMLSYRNVFCAECNNVTAPVSGCRFQVEDRFSTPQRIFSSANKANGNSACSDPNVNADVKKRFCRP